MRYIVAIQADLWPIRGTSPAAVSTSLMLGFRTGSHDAGKVEGDGDGWSKVIQGNNMEERDEEDQVQ